LVSYFNSVTEDFKVNPGAVECVSEQPNSSEHILIGYTRGLLVLWNRKTLSADQVNSISSTTNSYTYFCKISQICRLLLLPNNWKVLAGTLMARSLFPLITMGLQ